MATPIYLNDKEVYAVIRTDGDEYGNFPFIVDICTTLEVALSKLHRDAISYIDSNYTVKIRDGLNRSNTYNSKPSNFNDYGYNTILEVYKDSKLKYTEIIVRRYIKTK